MPQARLGNGNFVYTFNYNGSNYFGLLGVLQVDTTGLIVMASPSLTVQQAYAIDSKVDDGKPQTGNAIAYSYMNTTQWSFGWVQGGWRAGNWGWLNDGVLPGTSAPATSSTCYDNGGTTGTMNYSLTQNGGIGLNCTLSFKFQ